LVKVIIENNNLILEFDELMDIMTTAHKNAIIKSKTIVINQVEKNFKVRNVEKYKNDILIKLNQDSNVPVFLTAADITKYKTKENEYGGALITAGFEIPNCIYQEETFDVDCIGTINIISWLNIKLTLSGLLDFFRTVTEAKCISSSDLLLRCKSRSSGTSSDAIGVAAKISNNGIMYSGMATKHGNSIARIIHELLISFDKDTNTMLKRSLGLSLSEIVDEAMFIYNKAPVPNIDGKQVYNMIYKELENELKDPNVWSYIIAARELDLRGESNTFPFLSKEEYERDSKMIISDEALASSLSIYLSGFKGLTSTYWVDTIKDKENLKFSKLPMFEDDIVSALIGSTLSRIYDHLLRGK
jgi:alpha-ribazole phosphatase CobZ